MNITLDVDDYKIDEIIVQDLKNQYGYVTDSKTRKAIRRVLKYYMLREDYKAWKLHDKMADTGTDCPF